MLNVPQDNSLDCITRRVLIIITRSLSAEENVPTVWPHHQWSSLRSHPLPFDVAALFVRQRQRSALSHSTICHLLNPSFWLWLQQHCLRFTPGGEKHSTSFTPLEFRSLLWILILQKSGVTSHLDSNPVWAPIDRRWCHRCSHRVKHLLSCPPEQMTYWKMAVAQKSNLILEWESWSVLTLCWQVLWLHRFGVNHESTCCLHRHKLWTGSLTEQVTF